MPDTRFSRSWYDEGYSWTRIVFSWVILQRGDGSLSQVRPWTRLSNAEKGMGDGMEQGEELFKKFFGTRIAGR
jgi:hypothetical protein